MNYRYVIEKEINRRSQLQMSLGATQHPFLTPELSIIYLYKTILGRIPKVTEINPFSKQVKDNIPPKKITKVILYSCESFLKNSEPPKVIYCTFLEIIACRAHNFVNNLYFKTLGRAPYPHETEIWNKRLKYSNRIVVLFLFFRVLEFKNNFKLFVFSKLLFKLKFKIYKIKCAVNMLFKKQPHLFLSALHIGK